MGLYEKRTWFLWPISCSPCFAHSKELDLSTLQFSLQCHFYCFVEDSRVPAAHFTLCFWTNDIFCLDEKLTCHTLNTWHQYFFFHFVLWIRFIQSLTGKSSGLSNLFTLPRWMFISHMTNMTMLHFCCVHLLYANIMAISFHYQLLDFLYVFLSKSKIPFVFYLNWKHFLFHK